MIKKFESFIWSTMLPQFYQRPSQWKAKTLSSLVELSLAWTFIVAIVPYDEWYVETVLSMLVAKSGTAAVCASSELLVTENFSIMRFICFQNYFKSSDCNSGA